MKWKLRLQPFRFQFMARRQRNGLSWCISSVYEFNGNLTSFGACSGTMTNDDSREELLARALMHLRAAIELLDLADAPAQIAAHVDLGACQLADLIEPAEPTEMLEAGAVVEVR